MRLPNSVRNHLRETLYNCFYGVSLNTGKLYHFYYSNHTFTLLRPVGGEIVFEEAE